MRKTIKMLIYFVGGARVEEERFQFEWLAAQPLNWFVM